MIKSAIVSAIELLDIIREESGILVEKGLDAAGEPVVGFSHLTFQEYLAADAIRVQPEAIHLLHDNLFNPVWREVLLLYVAMHDATQILEKCLIADDQLWFRRYLLAGRCLVEGEDADEAKQRRIMTGLQRFLVEKGSSSPTIGKIIAQVGGQSNYDWLLDELADYLLDSEVEKLIIATWSIAMPISTLSCVRHYAAS